jgi:hypothetical protein
VYDVARVGSAVEVHADGACLGKFTRDGAMVLGADGGVLEYWAPPDWGSWVGVMLVAHGVVVLDVFRPGWARGSRPPAA